MTDVILNAEKDRRTLDLLAALLEHWASLPRFPDLTPLDLTIELQRIVPLDEAARLRSTSQDTLKRNEPDKIIKVSPRREGMRIKHALML
jgi:hypothetical protein